jgi:hypothetical protein
MLKRRGDSIILDRNNLLTSVMDDAVFSRSVDNVFVGGQMLAHS